MKPRKGLSKDQAVFLEILKRLKRHLNENGAPKERLLKFAILAALQEPNVDTWVGHFHSKIDLLAKDIRSDRNVMKAAYQTGMMEGILMALSDPTFMEDIPTSEEENVVEFKVVGA